MMPAHKAITSGMSLLSAARDVVTVPAKSARGTAYCSTIRFRVGASFEPKSCRCADTKPSRNVTTIGRSALKIMSSTAGHSPLPPRGHEQPSSRPASIRFVPGTTWISRFLTLNCLTERPKGLTGVPNTLTTPSDAPGNGAERVRWKDDCNRVLSQPLQRAKYLHRLYILCQDQ